MLNDKFSNFVSVLILSPHPDDEIIGCGGLISFLKEKNIKVEVAYITNGNKGIKHLSCEDTENIRYSEILEVKSFLKLDNIYTFSINDKELESNSDIFKKRINMLLRENKYSAIFIPNPNDYHPDHKYTFHYFLEEYKNLNKIKIPIYIYEGWENINSCSNIDRLDITDHFNNKIYAMKLYKSQVAQFDFEEKISLMAKSNTHMFIEKFILLEESDD